MKRVIQVLMIFFTASVALAQGTFVVPNGLASVEGNSSSGDLFNTSSRQMVQIYSVEELGLAPGASGLVSSVSFRVDGPSAQSFSGFWPGVSIYLSATPRGPDSVSPVFAENGDFALAFSGPLVIRATNSSLMPRSFEVQVPLSTPFLYNPAQGNLAMFVATLGGPANLSLDAQDTAGDGVGRVFGPNGAVSGAVDSLGFVTSFGMTVIPEPSATSLALIAALCALVRFCRKSTR